MPPPPRLGRKARAILALGVALVVVLAGIGVLAFVVPAQYPQHEYLTFDTEQGWNQYFCIPIQPGPSSTDVSFTWTASGQRLITLLVYPFPDGPFGIFGEPQLPVYNGTGWSGNGSYISGPTNDGTAAFVTSGNPNLSTYVNISLSYSLLGHYLGGPTTAAVCPPDVGNIPY